MRLKVTGRNVTGFALALIFIGGHYSHAITKGAMLGPRAVNPLDPDYSQSLWLEERIELRTPSAAEREVANQALAFAQDRFGSLLYARVDLLPAASGPVVVELELIEPSLFLGYAPGSADRLADAIAALITAA